MRRSRRSRDCATVQEVMMQDEKKTGKGLSWNDTENLALSKAAFIACTSPINGASMTAARLGRHILSDFISDQAKPRNACTGGRDGGLLDERRWDGRTSDACLKQWNKIKRECTKYHAAYRRVSGMELTGCPSDSDIRRCATAIYNEGSSMLSHLYDVIRNPDYRIGKSFSFPDSYSFLASKTSLLDAVEVQDNGEDGENGTPEKKRRPIGNKLAKRRKQEGQKGSGECRGDSMERKAGSMIASEEKIEKFLSESHRMKRSASQRHIELEEQKFHWEMAKELFGKDYGAPEEEAKEMRRLLRKRVLQSLYSGNGRMDVAVKSSADDSARFGICDGDAREGLQLEDMRTQPPPGYEDSGEAV